MRIGWPVCRVHDRRVEHHPEVEVGNPWKCPECEHPVSDEEQQE